MDVYKLFEENIRLAPWAVKKYFTNLFTDEDIQQCALLGLWKACITYKPEHSKFATYAVRVICNEVKMELRRRNKHYNRVVLVSLDEPMSESPDSGVLADVIPDPKFSDKLEEIHISEALKGLKLKERDKEVLTVYMKHEDQRRTAQELGVAQSTVSRALKCVRKQVHSIL